jgi:hypothetical protein
MGNHASSPPPKDLPPKDNYTDRELLNRFTALRHAKSPCSGFSDIHPALLSLLKDINEREINDDKHAASLYWRGCILTYIDRYV